MSLLKDIKGFQYKSLKKTDTTVMTPDGRKLLERRDEQGRYTQENIGADLGFVGDYKPDLQVGVILPGVLLGSQDAAANRETLDTHHVTHILNLAPGIEPAFPESFTTVTVPILDIPDTNITSYFNECFEFIQKVVHQNGCVLVHCNAGVSRSASIVIGYLICNKDMAFQQAYEYVKEKRPAIKPNAGFMEQLQKYKSSSR